MYSQTADEKEQSWVLKDWLHQELQAGVTAGAGARAGAGAGTGVSVGATGLDAPYQTCSLLPWLLLATPPLPAQDYDTRCDILKQELERDHALATHALQRKHELALAELQQAGALDRSHCQAELLQKYEVWMPSCARSIAVTVPIVVLLLGLEALMFVSRDLATS